MATQTLPRPIATRPTMVRLSAYVDVPLAEVVELLERIDLEDVLARAAADVVSPRLRITFETSTPVWESGAHVQVPVTWTATGPYRSDSGSGAVSLLTVRSGREGVTELLAGLSAPPEAHHGVARVTRRVLDELARTLEATT